MYLRVSAVALVAFSAGCAELRWHKPGVEREALERDLAECRESARARAAREAWPFSLMAPRVVGVERDGRVIMVYPPPHDTERFVLEQDLTRACMREKGYALVPVEKP